MTSFYDAQPPLLLAWFGSIDTDRGGSLSVTELQRALQLAGLSFSGKFCNSLINMVDNDCSGQLSQQEFLTLHAHLKKCAWNCSNPLPCSCPGRLGSALLLRAGPTRRS